MGEELLSFSDVEDCEQISATTRWRRVKRGRYETVETGRRLRNGAPERLIPLRCLSDRGQARWRARRPGRGPQRPEPPPDGAVPEGIPLTADNLPDEAEMEARGWDGILERYRQRVRAVAILDRERERRPDDKTLAARIVAELLDVSPRSLYRWREDLHEVGPAALVDVPPGRAGQTVLHPELRRRIKALYLNGPAPTKADVYRLEVLPWYAERRLDAPHYTTVCRWLSQALTLLEAVAFRDGRRTYEQDLAPRVRRDISSLAPNEWWCADHRKQDTLVRVSDGHGRGWGKHGRRTCPCGSRRQRRNCCSLVRPWLTAIVDVRTAAFVGWRIGVTPTAAGVCHALRSAALRFGLPAAFYRDNGKEFLARRLGGRTPPEPGGWMINPAAGDVKDVDRWPAFLSQDVEDAGFWIAYGVRIVTARPYSAWSKPIEPILGSLARAEKWIPGYVGNRPENRPESLDAAIREGTPLGWEQYTEVVGDMLYEWNTKHVCGDREAPPLELYESLPYEAVVPQRGALAYLLQDVRAVKVRQDGITLSGRRFYSPDIAVWVGTRLTVRWDPEDCADGIFVYPPEGGCLCVPPARDARYGAWNDANEQAALGAKAQRALLARTVKELEGVQVPAPSDGWRGDLQKRIEARAGAARQQKAIEARREAPEPPQETARERIAAAELVAELEEAGFGHTGQGEWELEDLAVALAEGLGLRMGEGRRARAVENLARLWGRACLSTTRGQRLLRRASPELRSYFGRGGVLLDEAPILDNHARWIETIREGRLTDPPPDLRNTENALLRLARLAERTWAGQVDAAAARMECAGVSEAVRGIEGFGEGRSFEAASDGLKALQRLHAA